MKPKHIFNVYFLVGMDALFTFLGYVNTCNKDFYVWLHCFSLCPLIPKTDIVINVKFWIVNHESLDELVKSVGIIWVVLSFFSHRELNLLFWYNHSLKTGFALYGLKNGLKID